MNRSRINILTRDTLRNNKRLFWPTTIYLLLTVGLGVLFAVFDNSDSPAIPLSVTFALVLLSPAMAIAFVFHYTYNDRRHHFLWIKSLRYSMPNVLAYVRVLITSAVCLVIIVFGLGLLIVPGIIFALRLSMVLHIRATDPRIGVFASIRGSFALTKGHTRDIGYYVLVAIGWLVLSAIFWPLYFYSLPYIHTCFGSLFRVMLVMAAHPDCSQDEIYEMASGGDFFGDAPPTHTDTDTDTSDPFARDSDTDTRSTSDSGVTLDSEVIRRSTSTAPTTGFDLRGVSHIDEVDFGALSEQLHDRFGQADSIDDDDSL